MQKAIKKLNKKLNSSRNNIEVLFFNGSPAKDDTIVCCSENPNKFSQEPYIEHTIDMDAFFEWLDENDGLSYIDEWICRRTGIHEQREGKLIREEFANKSMPEILKQLSKFLNQI